MKGAGNGPELRSAIGGAHGVGRWDPYVLLHGGAFDEYWRAKPGSTDGVLLILGEGFDPRMCDGLIRFADTGVLDQIDILLLSHGSGGTSATGVVRDLLGLNAKKIELIERGARNFERLQVKLRTEDGRGIGARAAAGIVASHKDVMMAHRDVIVDISALPRTLYFPIIGALIDAVDAAVTRRQRAPNLHVLVSESWSIDRQISEEGINSRADYLHGFAGGLDQESIAGLPTLWIPLLGEGQLAQLGRIYDLVVPDEICPVLPSPSEDPRRADDLVLEYRDLLFDRLRIEPKNIIYASEQNPFELYRQIKRTIIGYEGALNPLGGCKTALSVLSSKLMSVGALLAAYELKASGHHVGVAHVEATSYVPSEVLVGGGLSGSSEIWDLWIAGECYAT